MGYLQTRIGYICIALVAWVAAAACHAGLSTTTGKDAGTWTEEQCAVVVARIKDVVALDRGKDEGSHVATIVMIAKLAGSLDPGSSTTMQVRLSVRETGGSSVRTAPTAGQIVIAVVAPGYIAGDVKRPCIWVIPDICTFMPGRAAIVAIEGLGDKRVEETADRLREARHPAPATRATK